MDLDFGHVYPLTLDTFPLTLPLLPMRFSIWDIADTVAKGLDRRAHADDLEQAVYGFDHLDELGLHGGPNPIKSIVVN